uniref:Class I SAM-dependent methyltransferase n=1 Tax=Desertifilum tharense IPPAS B-1220 TaxID=1781255 RepID=A0ACD5H1W3_9CYAN
MATILRELSYRYQWLYDGVSQLAALSVGGERRFRQLALKNLDLQPQTQILDLCCGGWSNHAVSRRILPTGNRLRCFPLSLKRAQRNVPQASYVESFAESMPFEDNQFDVVHTSVAMHEMTPHQLQQILPEVYRVLRPGGTFALIDLHSPTNPLF